MSEHNPRDSPVVAFCWPQFGPYHMDRCEAVADQLGPSVSVYGIELSPQSRLYAWSRSGSGQMFRKMTLFPKELFEDISLYRRIVELYQAVTRLRAQAVFMSPPTNVENFVVAGLLRLRGIHVYAMTDSKLDDHQRLIWKELMKSFIYQTYRGVLVSGSRSRSYIRFMGIRMDRIVEGYDTISLSRVRAHVGVEPAPSSIAHKDRNFVVVARLVSTKNISTLIEAYRRYRLEAGPLAHALEILGSGPLEMELRDQARELTGISFRGFVQEQGVSEALHRGLALILPSSEEQWGLVVNEALAMGLPVLASENVGSRDALVRVGVNGYIFEPDNPEGLAHLMLRISLDEKEWHRLCGGSNQLAERGDTVHFACAVVSLLRRCPSIAIGHDDCPLAADTCSSQEHLLP